MTGGKQKRAVRSMGSSGSGDAPGKYILRARILFVKTELTLVLMGCFNS